MKGLIFQNVPKIPTFSMIERADFFNKITNIESNLWKF